MKVCPNCGEVIGYNSYFGAFICENCKWEDAHIGIKRNKGATVSAVFSIKAPKNILKKQPVKV